jgi:hypothetical protein
MIKRLFAYILIGTLALAAVPLAPVAKAETAWNIDSAFTVTPEKLPVFGEPAMDSGSKFYLYKGMDFTPSETRTQDGTEWFKVGNTSFWVPALEPNGVVNLTMETGSRTAKPIDLYGILDQPHRFAVKMVKGPGAKGRIETYEKVGESYIFRNSYEIAYRKEGPKEKYGDLKTPGGPVIRYIYRTTRSSRNGRSKEGAPFGVFKISYPMPHDALPDLLSGKMSVAEYNKIPAINYVGDTLYPQPEGMLGADILIHTQRWGSLGCVEVENEAMSKLYNEDLVTVNDKEIIPLVIYDENVVAPPVGQLF